MTSNQNITRTLNEAADLAGTLLRKRFRARLLVTEKSDASPVTEVDQEIEQALRALILKAHPTHTVCGEEFGQAGRDSDFQWVIDPIDGTRAFITGRPSFTTLIALLQDNVPVAGVIDQPITGERWIARSGRTTQYLSATFPGRVGTGNAPRDIAAAELSCTSPDMHDSTFLPRFERLKAAVKRTSWGGDAYAYGLLALGQIDVIAESDMKVWDWAALTPIVQGAGGCISDWHGNTLRADGDGSVLASANAALHERALGLLKISR